MYDDDSVNTSFTVIEKHSLVQCQIKSIDRL